MAINMKPQNKSVKVLLSNFNNNWFWNLLSGGVKDFEGTKFSHVAIFDQENVYEAVYPKAREISYKDWLNDHTVYKCYALDMNEDQYKSFMGIVYDFMGTEYSVFQLFLIWASHKSNFFGRLIRKHVWNGRHRSICTEVVAVPIMEVFHYDFGEEEDTIGLDEVEECLKKIGREVPAV